MRLLLQTPQDLNGMSREFFLFLLQQVTRLVSEGFDEQLREWLRELTDYSSQADQGARNLVLDLLDKISRDSVAWPEAR